MEMLAACEELGCGKEDKAILTELYSSPIRIPDSLCKLTWREFRREHAPVMFAGFRYEEFVDLEASTNSKTSIIIQSLRTAKKTHAHGLMFSWSKNANLKWAKVTVHVIDVEGRPVLQNKQLFYAMHFTVDDFIRMYWRFRPEFPDLKMPYWNQQVHANHIRHLKPYAYGRLEKIIKEKTGLE